MPVLFKSIQAEIPPDLLLDSDDEDIADEQQVEHSMPIFVHILACFLLLWQTFFHVSDAGISMLIVFLHHFFRIVAQADGCSMVLKQFANYWPKTIAALNKAFGIKKDDFTEFVVCPTCHSIYNFDDCVITRGTKKVSKVCEFKPYPRHPHRSKKQPCGTTLLRTVKTKQGSVLRPRKVYCFRSIISYLQQFLSRPGFVELCERWRNRPSSGSLGDIYDGRIWKEFATVNGKPFLSAPHNLLLSTNVDWFRPYTHTNESIGAIYMVVLNLPREVRFKPENVLLCGIIPGPKEPPYTLNSYLGPIVEELQKLWSGINVKLSVGRTISCRAALACCACDLPATRKLLGFSSYNSSHGCSKCLHFFPFDKNADKFDFSDFDYQNWKARDLSHYQSASKEYLKARTKAKQKEAVRDNGVRYCILTQLPYFNPIRFHVVDPMHNLLLGTAKHMMSTWLDRKILNSTDCEKIASIIEKFDCPAEVGRIPSKISSNFAGFTADQWRNWTLIYSCVALREVLSSEHLRCWMMFVKACQLLCSRIIKFDDVNTAHAYLSQFCILSKQLYGKECCTANFHMHFHLRECILDYGPVYSFWCFSFERYNGILGSYQTNNLTIEPQIMRKFLREQQVRFLNLNDDYIELSGLLKEMSCSTGSLACTQVSTATFSRYLCLRNKPLPGLDFQKCEEDGIKMIPPVTEHVLSGLERDNLCALFTKLHPHDQLSYITQVCRMSSRVSILGEMIGSEICRSDRSSYIVAYWPRCSSEDTFSCTPAVRQLSVGKVMFFIQHSVRIHGVVYKYVLACCKWFKEHPQRNWYGSSAIISSCSTHISSSFSFIPVQRIISKCSYGVMNVQFHGCCDTVGIAIPLDSKCSI